MSDETPKDPAAPQIRALHDMMPEDWDRRPLTLAHEIRTFLLTIVDQGRGVDSGSDGCSADLWATVGGVEWFINVRKSNSQLLKEGATRESLGLPPLDGDDKPTPGDVA